MGYDLYLKAPRQPAPETDWKDEASRKEYYAWQEESHSYLRRNIFGMGPVRDDMERLGMGFWAEKYVEQPAFPRHDSYGVTYNDEDEVVGDRAKEYEKDLADHLSWHGPEIPGIPLHKFCSNDGWHVTREECRAALHLYEEALKSGEPHPESFMDDVIPFLREAAATDGFEVN